VFENLERDIRDMFQEELKDIGCESDVSEAHPSEIASSSDNPI
jgi:hypothetical protein